MPLSSSSSDDSDSERHEPQEEADYPTSSIIIKGEHPPTFPKITDEWLIGMLKDYHCWLIRQRKQQQNDGDGSSEKKKKKDDKTKYEEEDDNEDLTLITNIVDGKYEDADTALSDIYRMRVEYRLSNETRSLHLIVKQLPWDPFSRFFVKEAQFDVREMKFYNEIVPDMRQFLKKHRVNLDLPIPECYYPLETFDTKGAPDVVLILENLKTRGFSNSRFCDGLTKEEATSALKAIAKIHALSLAMKIEHGDLNQKYPFLFQTDKATDSYQMLLERGLPQLGLFLQHKPHMRNVFRAIGDIQSRSKQLISSLLIANGPLSLLTHTDFWCNNLLFQRDTERCMIVDWQMIAYSRPTNDVALLILSSLPTELRREFADQLLNEYWNELKEHSKILNVNIEDDLHYGRDDLQNDYKKSQLLAILLCIGSVDIALGNFDTEKRLLDLLEDLHDAQMFSEQMIEECIR